MAWKACAFALRRSDLFPGYYCPTCEYNPDNDRVRDVENGCPKCPLTELYKGVFEGGAKKLLEKYKRVPDGWDVEGVINLHGIVSRILGENKDRIDARWSMTFAQLCRIVQQERAQMKFVEDWNHMQKIRSVGK